ncbi:hypothetical protein HPB48_021525 [Haemaphysalis longicornis]|uniref:CCHC-type domain-containing protein n=1 Tax=Haemaphysalis longicornis TaxID=44386 RepID=A0A9J6FBU4_HAELO|nr:hypothetical protein HPB48_021525 [Haemaphysalis longicornis]
MSDYKIIYRPGGGLDLRPVNGGMLLQTVCRCADVDFAISRTQDKLSINPFNNSFTISTPSEERMKRFELQINVQQHPLSAYVAAPGDAIKGIIYNAVYDQTQDEIFEEIINLNKSRNYTIADARQLGKTQSLLITFIATKEVPRETIIFGSIYTCYPFKAKFETCFNCRGAGHRADVCPKEKTGLCRMCGGQHPVKEQPDCTPKCILCNGGHFMGTRKCKQRFEIPGNFKGRTSTSTENPWQRGQQQQATGERRASLVQKSIKIELQDRKKAQQNSLTTPSHPSGDPRARNAQTRAPGMKLTDNPALSAHNGQRLPAVGKGGMTYGRERGNMGASATSA